MGVLLHGYNSVFLIRHYLNTIFSKFCYSGGSRNRYTNPKQAKYKINFDRIKG